MFPLHRKNGFSIVQPDYHLWRTLQGGGGAWTLVSIPSFATDGFIGVQLSSIACDPAGSALCMCVCGLVSFCYCSLEAIATP